MKNALQSVCDEDRQATETPVPLPSAPPSDFIPVEMAFETIGYFTPSSKVIKRVTTKETILTETVAPDGTRLLRKIAIIASGKYGLPITADLDYYRAFLKILEQHLTRDGQLTEPIGVPTKTLLRYAGKRPNARVLREVKEWIRRGHATVLEGFFYRAEQGEYLEIGAEPLFPHSYLRGQRLETGEVAETNYVWLASWFRANYLHHHVRPIDLAVHQRLRKPLSKALLPLIEMGWYAASGQAYRKSYHDLCQTFLLTKYAHLADITRQLDPAHRELVRERVLAQWTYHRATTKRDWVLTYLPGEKFFEDQQARQARQRHAIDIAQRTVASSKPARRLAGAPLLEEMMSVCGDRQNQAAYQKMLRTYPEGVLWMALSETRQADREGRILTSKGAYFMDTVKRLAVLRAEGGRPTPEAPSPTAPAETPPAVVSVVATAAAPAQQRQVATAPAERRRRQAEDEQYRQYEAYRAASLAQLRATLPPENLAAIEQAAAAPFERLPASAFGHERLRQLALDEAVAAYGKLATFPEWQATQPQPVD